MKTELVIKNGILEGEIVRVIIAMDEMVSRLVKRRAPFGQLINSPWFSQQTNPLLHFLQHTFVFGAVLDIYFTKVETKHAKIKGIHHSTNRNYEKK